MALSPDGRPCPRIALFALILTLVGAASMVYYHLGLLLPRMLQVRASIGLGNGYSFGDDFYPVWLTALESAHGHRDLYSLEMTRKIQVGLFGRPLDPHNPFDPPVDYRQFAYPAFTDLLFWPAAEFPFPIVRVVAVMMLAVLTFVSVFLWLGALEWRTNWMGVVIILLLTLCSYSALDGLFAGQLGLLVAFLLSASIYALKQDRFLFAGFLMALTSIKPQMTVLPVLYLLLWSYYHWRASNRFFIGYFSTCALLIGAALLVQPHWIQSWISTVSAYRSTTPALITEVLTSRLRPRWSGPATFLLMATSIVMAAILAWRSRKAAISSPQFWLTLSILLAITIITVLPGQSIYDHLILVPAVLVLARYRGRLFEAGMVSRISFLIGAVILFWPGIAAFALIVLRPVLPAATFGSTPVLSLPIRTAAALPFVIFVLLLWVWKSDPEKRAEV